eukprot:gb/GFBE01018568.1/.p1 GENE.gb/GFBE01018568.1/~~gb/GFBE01018568.1/.p1  ORF type:complete len:553 (+),score=57.34 gb/GFBE01018568.1/:1-1659(+)
MVSYVPPGHGGSMRVPVQASPHVAVASWAPSPSMVHRSLLRAPGSPQGASVVVAAGGGYPQPCLGRRQSPPATLRPTLGGAVLSQPRTVSVRSGYPQGTTSARQPQASAACAACSSQSHVPQPQSLAVRPGSSQATWKPTTMPANVTPATPATTSRGAASPPPARSPPTSAAMRQGSPLATTRGSPLASPRVTRADSRAMTSHQDGRPKILTSRSKQQGSQTAFAAASSRSTVKLTMWPMPTSQGEQGSSAALPQADSANLVRLQSVPAISRENPQASRPIIFGGSLHASPGGSLKAPAGTSAGSLRVSSSVPPNKRGGALPHSYTMPAADSIDAAVLAQLQCDPLLCKLVVKRLGPGEYVVDSRHVSIRWAPGVRPGSAADLLVHEAGVGGETPSSDSQEDLTSQDAAGMPLPDYLRQAADVNAALGASAVSRIPQEKRLSFDAPGIGVEEREHADLMARCASMRQACEEARLRAQAAEAYESGRPIQWQGQKMTAPASPHESYRDPQAWTKKAERPAGAVRLAQTLARIEGRGSNASEESESSDSDESEG